MLAQHSEAVPAIGKDALNRRPLPGLTAALFDLGDTAEFATRCELGLLPRHSAFDQLFDFLFEMGLNLLGDILLEATTLKQSRDEVHEFHRCETGMTLLGLRPKLATCYLIKVYNSMPRAK